MSKNWILVDTYEIEYDGGFIKSVPELIYDQLVCVNVEHITSVNDLKGYPGFCVFHLINGKNYITKLDNWELLKKNYIGLIA